MRDVNSSDNSSNSRFVINLLIPLSPFEVFFVHFLLLLISLGGNQNSVGSPTLPFCRCLAQYWLDNFFYHTIHPREIPKINPGKNDIPAISGK
jgi:hypothetical protein